MCVLEWPLVALLTRISLKNSIRAVQSTHFIARYKNRSAEVPWLLLYGFPTCGPPICIVRPASIYVNCVYTTGFTG